MMAAAVDKPRFPGYRDCPCGKRHWCDEDGVSQEPACWYELAMRRRIRRKRV